MPPPPLSPPAPASPLCFQERLFPLWDWVGGRYSVCSSVGALPLSLKYGFQQFDSFLAGESWYKRSRIFPRPFRDFPTISSRVPQRLVLPGYETVMRLCSVVPLVFLFVSPHTSPHLAVKVFLIEVLGYEALL